MAFQRWSNHNQYKLRASRKMENTSLPENLRAFILRNVDSIGHLEALLLLFRNPDAAFSAGALAQQLYINEQASAHILERLHERSFASRSGQDYRYAYSPATHELVSMLEQHHARHLIAITELIHANTRPPHRIQEFAKAFKFRKDK